MPVTVTLHLRIPEELKARIDQAAQESGRSINSELVRRISTSFEPQQLSLDLDDVQKALRKVLREEGIIAADLKGKRR